ncbi:transmembrane protein 183A isoform X1 [Cervus elaphus]|uniref:transmembrane protein 183A isoform X1 n=1 Tax=Cervus canadensis TaxID=1574408 RepID=UPI0018BD3A87|nr:transmembrane protein 183A isoform X1 [Cervus canadensis]XP_043780645.1 transmembrane protein 183A isoform X1 [Cervus elaphus]
MARGPGPLTRPRPDTVVMPKRGKRLKFRAQDACSGRVTVADYANSDPAVVRSGRVKKAVANAVQQEVKSLCGLEASQVPAVEALSGAGEPCDIIDSSGETDAQEESIHERTISRKKKSKRHREDLDGTGGEEYPMDIWLLLASYIRPEDIVNFSLICKNAWTVTCTAAFWTRLYRRHYTLDASLPLRLRPESMEKLHCLRACVIRSLYHMYEPFAARISKNPAIPESTPSTLKNSKTFDHRRLTVVRWDHPKADRGRVLISCWEQSSTGQTSCWTSLRLQCTISIACVGHWSRCVGSRSVYPLKPSPLFLMEQQDVQGMSEGQDSWHGGRPTPYPLGVLTFLVQKDCWEQTGTNVGIQLQVQKTVPKIKEQVYGRIAASHSVRRCSYQPGPGLLPTAGHHPQFHLYSNCHGNDIYPVYYQREHGHAASSSETGVPRLSCPWWSETAQ